MRKFGRRGSKRLAVGIELSKRNFRPRYRRSDLSLQVSDHLLPLGRGIGDPQEALGAFDVRNRNHFAFLRFRGAAIEPKDGAT